MERDPTIELLAARQAESPRMSIVYRRTTTSLYFHGLKPAFLINSMGLSLSSCFPVAWAATGASAAFIAASQAMVKQTGDKRYLYPVVPLTGALFGSLILLGRSSGYWHRTVRSLPVDLCLNIGSYTLFAGLGISILKSYARYLYETREQKSDELNPSS